MTPVTHLLDAAAAGDRQAAADLLPVLYGELRKLAAARLASEPGGQTLQATALVHEAYLKLVGGQQPRDWNGRGHFFAAAAEAMRRILIDRARRKRRPKHGGGRERWDLDDLELPSDDRADELLALDEALSALARAEPAKAELVKLRYFAGLTLEEAAACLGITAGTAKRHWALARAWLFAALSDRSGPVD
ncbi:MAG TPA: ECF-type sigma factor [Gemmataceae bacterium]|nr:ECF-type sigma factor [Gemmataceae bacterium]